jgi:hypothetical protein
LFVLPAAAAPATLTVGPSGTYATLQDAIDTAIGSAIDNEIRVESGTYVESLVIDFSLNHNLEIRGGWDSTFSTQALNPALTVIGNVAGGRIFEISHSAGRVVLHNLHIRGGSVTDESGAGIQAYPYGTGELYVLGCKVSHNTITVSPGFGSQGAGLRVRLLSNQRFELRDSEIHHNAIVGGSGQGAGAHLVGYDFNSSIEVVRNSIHDNVVTLAGGGAEGTGIEFELSGESTALITDNRIEDNITNGSTTAGNRGSGLSIGLLDQASAIARRNVLLGNLDLTTGFGQQLDIGPTGNSAVLLSDTVVGNGSIRGVTLSNLDPGVILHVTNLTVYGHSGQGTASFVGAGSTTTLSNSISFGNGTDLNATPGTLLTNNLIGVDPLFVNPAAGDFRLQAGSPAIDFGTLSPPDGLGPFDQAHAPRVNGPLPDAGALEFGALFGDGFESGDASWWSQAVP